MSLPVTGGRGGKLKKWSLFVLRFGIGCSLRNCAGQEAEGWELRFPCCPVHIAFRYNQVRSAAEIRSYCGSCWRE